MDAIKYFKGMRESLCETYLKAISKDSVGYQATLIEMSFYDEAIKALEQKPCEDAISRAEAIRIASGYCHWTNIPKELEKLPSVNPIPCEDAISRQEAIDVINTAWTIDDLDNLKNAMITDMIKELPSVSTEKTGRWIYKTMKGQFCSICDEQSVWKFKYCPNCGAKMVEPQESEE